MIHHTGFGTITLLANVLGGLQILSPGRKPDEQDAWKSVKPQPRCLVVNLGDAMVKWTRGLLRSNMHRISFTPREQCRWHRYSVAIFMRPHKDACMQSLTQGAQQSQGARLGRNIELTDSPGGAMTAREWEVERAVALREGSEFAHSKGGIVET